MKLWLSSLNYLNDDQEVYDQTNYFWRCRLDLVSAFWRYNQDKINAHLKLSLSLFTDLLYHIKDIESVWGQLGYLFLFQLFNRRFNQTKCHVTIL